MQRTVRVPVPFLFSVETFEVGPRQYGARATVLGREVVARHRTPELAVAALEEAVKRLLEEGLRWTVMTADDAGTFRFAG